MAAYSTSLTPVDCKKGSVANAFWPKGSKCSSSRGQKALATDPFLQSTGVKEVEYAAIYAFTGGDARRFLNTLESLCLVAKNSGQTKVDAAFVGQHAPKMAPKYDRAGDQHYDIASALIKSIRGSDPQAAVYWLARMIAVGQ